MNLLHCDEIALRRHLDLSIDDKCYYWHEYTPGENFNYSPTNQLIHNFKISVLEEKKERKYHKSVAIQQIAREFCNVIQKDSTYKEFTFVPIPPSKISSHPEYDDRLLKVLNEVSKLKKIEMDIRPLVYQSTNTEAAHTSSHRLSVEELYGLYRVEENLINPVPKKVIIFDDILTKGTHFKALQKIIKNTWPHVPIFGLFIARSIYSTIHLL